MEKWSAGTQCPLCGMIGESGFVQIPILFEELIVLLAKVVGVCFSQSDAFGKLGPFTPQSKAWGYQDSHLIYLQYPITPFLQNDQLPKPEIKGM